jgi:NAD(P)-dependent dehydrogenase (short-subunit alcohol dehydrogenase family)
MKLSLENGVAVVTGGGSGIGREVCLRAAADGAAVAVVDVNAEAVQAVAATITAGGGRALALTCDVSNAAQVADTIAQVVAALGAPTLLFNVAGIVRYARVEDIEPAAFERVLAVNLFGTFLMSRAVLPHLVNCRGSIVNVSSMAGHLGIPYAAAYCASKGGVIAMTKSMAKEFADRGVRINVLAPGGVETPMAAVPFPDDANPKVLGIIPITPMGFAKPESIAQLAVFIASKECGPLSGALIPIDGAST